MRKARSGVAAWGWALALAGALAGCDLKPAQIQYDPAPRRPGRRLQRHRRVFGRSHRAFVFFRLRGVDNTRTDRDYLFGPLRLALQTGDPSSQYVRYATEILTDTLYLPRASLKTLVPKGKRCPRARPPTWAPKSSSGIVFRRVTADADGAREANAISYFLSYDRAVDDPPLLLVRGNAGRTQWPYTPVCNPLERPA